MLVRTYVACAAVVALSFGLATGIVSYTSIPGPEGAARVAALDLAIKGAGGALALGGTLIAVLRYLDDRSKAIETASLEARKPFLERRQSVYVELVQTTAVLGTIEDCNDPAAIDAARRFWAVYWGTLPLVTDEAVSLLVDKFSELIADESTDWVGRRNLSMNIARACRASMGFDPPLPDPGSVATRNDARPSR